MWKIMHMIFVCRNPNKLYVMYLTIAPWILTDFTSICKLISVFFFKKFIEVYLIYGVVYIQL